ncbi:uncharacterized protein LOC128989031 [Macrosteles quadrilineatus]|uniref:uncharacterized protein LOC128989031 n=1 Tax=Macrosteles quadrilineatus TaxID=74068 RepID=UPI0023E34A7B|nr:uncharacterized protein LOC128989031 [Macrosteles quadrilineatus]
MSRFTASDDEQLIELVQGHPIIWNIMEKDYKNVVKKEFIWSDIGKTMNKTGTECKARWKNMRDYFRKQKKEERNQTTGSAATKRKAGYWERLRFLDVVPEERCSLTNIESSVSEESFGDQLDYVDDLLDLTASNVQGDISESDSGQRRADSVLRCPLSVVRSPPADSAARKTQLLQL